MVHLTHTLTLSDPTFFLVITWLLLYHLNFKSEASAHAQIYTFSIPVNFIDEVWPGKINIFSFLQLSDMAWSWDLY